MSDANGSGGQRFDAGKVRTDLISPIALWAVARVYTKGAVKYRDHDWRKGMPWSKCIAPLMRHLIKFMMGQDYDTDPNCEDCKNKSCKNHTGELHIDQVLWNAMALSEYARTHKELDDRYKTPDIELKEGA